MPERYNRIKAIPLYLDQEDIKQLHYQLTMLMANQNFNEDIIVLLGQTPMTCDLYMSVRYNGLADDYTITFN